MGQQQPGLGGTVLTMWVLPSIHLDICGEKRGSALKYRPHVVSLLPPSFGGNVINVGV